MQHALYRSMQYGMRCKQQRDKISTITKRNKYKPSASAHTHYLSEKVQPCIHVNCWLSGLDFHSFTQFATCPITLPCQNLHLGHYLSHCQTSMLSLIMLSPRCQRALPCISTMLSDTSLQGPAGLTNVGLSTLMA